jgi:hypothetical protein
MAFANFRKPVPPRSNNVHPDATGFRKGPLNTMYVVRERRSRLSTPYRFHTNSAKRDETHVRRLQTQGHRVTNPSPEGTTTWRREGEGTYPAPAPAPAAVAGPVAVPLEARSSVVTWRPPPGMAT